MIKCQKATGFEHATFRFKAEHATNTLLWSYDKYDENDDYIYDGNNKVQFEPHPNKWKWILFPKRFKYETTELVEGTKFEFSCFNYLFIRYFRLWCKY